MTRAIHEAAKVSGEVHDSIRIATSARRYAIAMLQIESDAIPRRSFDSKAWLKRSEFRYGRVPRLFCALLTDSVVAGDLFRLGCVQTCASLAGFFDKVRKLEAACLSLDEQ
jgi:hypothetical protein